MLNQGSVAHPLLWLTAAIRSRQGWVCLASEQPPPVLDDLNNFVPCGLRPAFNGRALRRFGHSHGIAQVFQIVKCWAC